MTTKQLLGQATQEIVHNKKVMIVPVSVWKLIEDELEDLEMLRSAHLAQDVAQARKEMNQGKTTPLDEMSGV